MEITENKFVADPARTAVKESAPAPEQEAPKYDPQKRYRWGKDSKFYFTGGEFGLILNAMRQLLSTPEAQAIMLAERANEIVEKTLATAVATGVAVEEKAPN